MQNAVVDDVSVEAHAQHVVPGMPHRLPHQEQPILGRLQQLHRLLARDLPVEPPAVAGGRVGPGRPGPPDPSSLGQPHYSRHEAELGIRGEGLTLPQRTRRQQPLLPAGVVLGSVPALALPGRETGVSIGGGVWGCS